MREQDTLNFYKWLFGTSMLPHIAVLLHLPFIGLAWTGFAWVIMLLVALFYLSKGSKVTMPYGMWLPWVSIVLLYWIGDFSYYGLQASCQYLSYLFVGFAASTLYYSETIMLKLFRWFIYFAIYLIFGKILSFIISVSFVAGMAALVMSYCVLSAVFISIALIYHQKKFFLFYGCAIMITALLVTRMGILMILVMGAFHFAFKKVSYKMAFITIIAVVGVIIFNTDAFQEKTFGKKRGKLSDLQMEGGRFTNINNNGREYMWNLMDKGIKESPVWGHGSRADLRLLQRSGLPFTECHNDYKAITYDYGYVGLICLFFGFIFQFLFLRKQKKYIIDKKTAVTYYSALTLFLVWVGFMYSDNVMKYATHFGNLHWCLIGITYSRIILIKNAFSSNTSL